MLRFQLNNSFVGSLLIEREDPIDINSLVKDIRRSKEFHGVFFEIVLDVKFIEDGREFVKKAFELGGGIQAITAVIIYKLNPDTHKWSVYYNGRVDYNKYEVGETDIV